MRFQTHLAAATTALWAASTTPDAQSQKGSLSWVENDAPFTFKYSTPDPNSRNWVGLYDSAGGGPVDQEKGSSASLLWKWAPDSQGSLVLAASSLGPGNYTAFFLADNGYKWLADPVEVILAHTPGDTLNFIATDVTLPNARQGQEFIQNVAGFVKGPGKVTFSQSGSGNDWINVSPEGIISGTPGFSVTETYVEILAQGDDGSKATAGFIIPVRPVGSPLIDQLKVLTFNMWNGGTRVNNYHEKQVRFLAKSGADLIALQEDQNGRHVPRLAKALGWYYWASGGDTSMISKYPIVEDYGVINRHSGGVRIALDGDDQQINLYDTHLGYNPYGPYDFCFDKMPMEKVMEREAQSGRTPQVKELLAAMDRHLKQADKVPVILAGDFNAPSHLDWVKALAEKNCGFFDVPWPTSTLPQEKGLIDSFRVAHPDPAVEQGLTWSPINPWNGGRHRPEPQDRIDYIYHKGKGLKVIESKKVLVGEPKTDYRDNEWTSDHAAILTVYELSSN